MTEDEARDLRERRRDRTCGNDRIRTGVRVRARLQKIYGRGRWRKRKGIATVRLPNGKLRRVELHWYEAHGIGRIDFKIKTYLDQS